VQSISTSRTVNMFEAVFLLTVGVVVLLLFCATAGVVGEGTKNK